MKLPEIMAALPSYACAVANLKEQARQAHAKAFSKYKNFYTGRDVVVMAPGPTVKIFNKIDNVIYVGVNKAVLYPDIKLDYFFVSDYTDDVILNNELRLANHSFYGINLNFSPNRIPDKVINGFADKYYSYVFERKPEDYHFRADIAQGMQETPVSTVFMAMLFALYTNPARIFLVGCDCGDFTRSGDSTNIYQNSSLDYKPLLLGWQAIKEFAAREYPQVKIISINPCALASMFDDQIQNENAFLCLQYSERGEYEMAFEYILKALKWEPDNLRFLTLKTEILRKLGKNREFEREIKEIVGYYPEWVDGYGQLSSYYQEMNDEDNAIFWATACVENNKSNLQGRLNLALLLRSFGKREELSALLSQTDSPAFNAHLAFSIYKKSWWNSDLKESVAICREALSYYNDLPIIHYWYNSHLISMGDLTCADEAINYSVKHFPDYGWGYFLKIKVSLARGDMAQAIRDCRALWQLETIWAQSWQMWLDIFLSMNMPHKALKLANEIKAQNPRHPSLKLYFAKIYAATGQTTKALHEARAGYEEYPLWRARYIYDYIVRYANLLWKNGEIKKAEEVLIQATDTYQDYSPFWRALSSLYDFAGKQGDALFAARKAVAIDPANIDNCLYLSNILRKQRKFDEAREIIKERLALNPDWSEGWNRLTQLCEDIKDENWRENSLEYIRKAMAIDPSNLKYINIFINKIKSLSPETFLKELITVLNNNPLWGTGWFRLSLYLKGLQEYDSAFYCACKALIVSPRDQWCRARFVDALMDKKELKAAEREARTFIELFPEDGLAQRQLANAQYLNALEQACLKDPLKVNELWKAFIETLHVKKLYYAEKKAVEMALKFNPQWGWGWLRLENITKDQEEKKSLYLEALKFNPAWGHAYFRLSQLHEVDNGQYNS